MELNFNIIFTPGTVKYLQLFVFSLLKWSDCSFRLVANGCPPAEIHLLQTLCQREPRLEFLALDTKTVLTHSQVLFYLQARERSDHFCFIDSDILATGEFMGNIASYIGNYAGIFSGAPIWCKNGEMLSLDALPFITGRFNRTEQGLCLGNTYFAIYDNTVLSQFIQSTGIGFDIFRWPDIPARWQNAFTEMGLSRRVYDAGKVLNLALLAQGERLIYVESTHLHHLGGISTYTTYKNRPLHKRALTKLKHLKRQTKSRLGQLNKEKSPLADAKAKAEQTKKKEFRAVLYFANVLRALFESRPLPAVPHMSDPEINERIAATTEAIISTYAEFKAKLA